MAASKPDINSLYKYFVARVTKKLFGRILLHHPPGFAGLFLKENNDVTKEEISYVEESVKNLDPTEIEINGNKFTYKDIFKMTMIDGLQCCSRH